jgi:amino acid permease
MVKNKFFTGVSILMGTCIGAGILGMPYLVSKAGFFPSMVLIFFLTILMTLINLYIGEITLRTKEKHQLSGYAEKYLGRKGKFFMEFATIFGIFSAIVAYLFAVGESISFLIYGNTKNFILFGILFGVLMSALIWKGIHGLKKIEKINISIIILAIVSMIFIFANKINFANLSHISSENFFIPFGIILFSLLCSSAIPEMNFAFGKDKKLMKKSIIIGMISIALIYFLFNLIVIGLNGINTPEIATLSLGTIFVLFGILTLFGAYVALGNALEQTFISDNKFSKAKSWFLSSIIPIILFFIVGYFNILSFTKMLAIGGVISGGMTGILILFILKNAKKNGNRKPEYSIPINWFLIILISLIFIGAILFELF